MGELVQGMMKTLCLSQAQLAQGLGIPYDTVRGWSSGRADPSQENRAAMVVFLRQHAAHLLRLAEDLEG